MALQIPAELKKITPFIKRAEELDKDKSNAESRLVAYYCRQYAVHVGIPLSKSEASKQCLGQILGDLETEKGPMSNFTRDEAKYLCTNFANKIFTKADEQDRAGQATKVTARTFYASATFYDMLQQFAPSSDAELTEDQQMEQEDVKNKTIYAKWKATEILKALREGRQPTPGGYGSTTNDDDDEKEEEVKEEKEPEQEPPAAPKQEKEEEEEEDPLAALLPPPPLPMPMTVQSDDDDDDEEEEEKEEEDQDAGTEVELLGPPPEYGSANKPPEVFVDDRPPLSSTSHIPPPPLPPILPPPSLPDTSSKNSTGGGGLFGLGASHAKKQTTTPKKKKKNTGPIKATKQQLEDATELTKFALSALQSKDSELAASRLEQALEALGRY